MSRSPFTDDSPDRVEGWEVGWLERPGMVVLGLFDHVLDADGWTDFERLGHPVRWPEELIDDFLPADRSWIVDLPGSFFRPLAGTWPWSPERKRLRGTGAQWRRAAGGRVLADLPSSLGAARAEPFAYAASGPDRIVSWAFVPTAPVELASATDWAMRAMNRAADLLAGPCARIVGLQDGHVFVVESQKRNLQVHLEQVAQRLALPLPARDRTLRTSPVR